LVAKTENPRLPRQSRVLENILVLEFYSHDANKTGRALTNGHPAIARRVHRYLFGKRSFHFDAAIKQYIG
jgi:hypothetical protein